MTAPKAALAGLGIALAACSSLDPGAGALNLGQPSDLVAFRGITRRAPGEVRPYVAIASSGTDDVRILDPSDNRPVMSPGLAYPLSVPTAPSPAHLAASPLYDADGQKADLLAVSSAGSLELQVVATWLEETRVAGPPVDLTAVAAPGSVVLSLLGAPAFDPGGVAPAAGRARLLAGLSGGKLAVVEVARAPDGSVVQAGPPAVRDLGFDPVHLALGPDLVHVYAATPDVITDSAGASLLGVAEIDAADPDPALWTVRGLRAGPPGTAGAPTRLVAAAVLAERTAADADAFGPEVLRVYAALDGSGCGPEAPIRCGIATLDPATAELAPDLAPAGFSVPPQSYRAPMELPGTPLAIAIAKPPAQGAQTVNDSCESLRLKWGGSYILIAPLIGQICTTAVMVVGASDGVSYYLDLGRSQAPTDTNTLTTSARVSALNGSPLLPEGVDPSTVSLVALWDLDPPDGSASAPSTDSAVIARSVLVQPGFTYADDWRIVWQGALPKLELRRGVAGRRNGEVFVAGQVRDGSGWYATARLDDPRLGVHETGFAPGDPGDVVEVYPRSGEVGGVPCAREEARAVAVLPGAPDPGAADWPGGALSLGPGPFACLGGLAEGAEPQEVFFTVRASGLLLAGARTGYAGRPALDTTGAGPLSGLAWADEGPLEAACAAGARPGCEGLYVARKARRFHYPHYRCRNADGTPTGACSLYSYYMQDALAPAPVVAFRVGMVGPQPLPLRDARIVFSTQSGWTPSSRAPGTVSLPTAAIALDRSLFPGRTNDGTWFYVSYSGNVVLGFAPGQFITLAETIR